MFEFIFTNVIPLIVLLGFAFFMVVLVHELGHAIPVLLMTRGNVKIYIGSMGDGRASLRVPFGRLILNCKKNPLTWYKGCCIFSSYELSLNQRILFTAGGPIASIILTIATWGLVSVAQDADFWRIIFGGVFFISMIVTFSILVPVYKVRYTPAGSPVYHDVYQLFRLIRQKY